MAPILPATEVAGASTPLRFAAAGCLNSWVRLSQPAATLGDFATFIGCSSKAHQNEIVDGHRRRKSAGYNGLPHFRRPKSGDLALRALDAICVRVLKLRLRK